MILDEFILVKISKKNIEHFKKLGYNAYLKEFLKVNPYDINGGSHIKIHVKCDVCDKEKIILFQKYYKNIKNGGFYACSSKCAQEKVKNTSIKNFGSEYYTQTKEYKEKCTITSQSKYGTNHHIQSDIIKKKIAETNLKLYGSENVFASEIIKKKILETNLKKYGCENPSSNKEIQEKISKSKLGKSKVEKEYIRYRNKVMGLTYKIKDKFIENWDGYDYYDNEYIKENFILSKNDKNFPQIDHKISINFGYKNNISAEEIADIKNLCITKSYINRKKSNKTEEEYGQIY